MRFVWAIVAFVLATFMIGAGIAQRTVFLGPAELRTELSVGQPESFTLIDGDVLRSQPGEQTLIARGEGSIVFAVARSADAEAWLADARYNHISLDDEGEIVSTLVLPSISESPDAEDDAASESDDETAEEGEESPSSTEGSHRNPAGSDLWLDEFTDTDSLFAHTRLPEGVSVVIASDGTEPAPSDVTVTWPLDNSTPWAGPLMVGGAILMALGVILYIQAVRHVRRGRGPRRKGPPPLPPTEPIDIALETGSRRAIGSQTSAPQRRSRGRRSLIALPALGMSAVLLAGCTADSWPQFDSTPTPTPTETVVAPENQQDPAMTEAQAIRVLQRIADTVEQADEEMDADLAATRLDGMALTTRKVNYRLRSSIADTEMPLAIPGSTVRILVPQAFQAWPRTTMLLVEDSEDETVPPIILTMTQQDPWSNYKVSYLAEMQAAAELPDLPPAWMGAKLTPPDSPFLVLPPGELAEAFADVVDNGDSSQWRGLFGKSAMEFAETVQASRASITKALADSGAAETTKTSFSMIVSGEEPVGLAGIDSAAVVAVSLRDVEQVTPTDKDAVIRLGSNEPAKLLTGVDESAEGFQTSYSIQLFFAVPAQGSNGQIQLLAVSQDLLSVKEIEK
ncbi:glycosyl transferase [Microbacterium sp. YY-01]|uniref:glycosyl transferase n=1 Tax=Microbacterium sp. YY-01 TaxID=3421634 RepID=UPI003D16E808